jgi:hypothetical protein
MLQVYVLEQNDGKGTEKLGAPREVISLPAIRRPLAAARPPTAIRLGG